MNLPEKMLYGADYNPDQWLDYPEIINDDFKLMKKANTNTFTLNIFGWSALEPTEGEYTFGWLDDIMDRMAEQDQNVILTTPSGAKPAWMSEKYPEIRRVNANRLRELHGLRHNHCFTSPVYRKKVKEMNTLLAERYKNHKALVMWHISNEYSGECHCDFCQDAFRNWLKAKYGTLDNLNKKWWTAFWSHTFTDWSQVVSPSPIGESQVHALTLDWNRFVTHQTIDFYKNEVAPLKKITPSIPCTTNFMGGYPSMEPFSGLDYGKFAQALDVVSWDAYPEWHSPRQSDYNVACSTSFVSDLYRVLNKKKPFILMECTPSGVNWQEAAKLKEPGLNELQALHSVAHGANGILYFQWRKSMGSAEKFHGSVISHDNRDDTRVFREVAELGKTLSKLNEIVDTNKKASVAVLYDWENKWAFEDSQGYGRDSKKYADTVKKHYKAVWESGINIDVVTYNEDLSDYKLLIGPMLYLLPDHKVEQIKQFVEQGGTFVTTYISNTVDEFDLVKGADKTFQNITGVRVEEIDSLFPEDTIKFTYNYKVFEGKDYCESIHLTDAESLGLYENHFLKHSSALTKNRYGKGQVYYMGVRGQEDFLQSFYTDLLEELDLAEETEFKNTGNIIVQSRSNAEDTYYFFMNFSRESSVYVSQSLAGMTDILSNEVITGNELILESYGYKILKTTR